MTPKLNYCSYLVLLSVMFGREIMIAFRTVHVLCCVLVKVLNYTTVVHVPCAAIESSMPKLHCHTFTIHILIGLVGADV